MVLALLAGGILFWFLSYGVESRPPERLAMSALSQPAEVVWDREGVVSITAQNEADAYVALGYAHGRKRLWSAVLWRQAALGQMAEWFGEDAVTLDHLTRQLGLARGARQDYGSLTDEERTLLDAYSRGLNVVLDSRAGRLQEELVLLDVEPALWEPWHTLAVERLFAWLASTPLAPEDRRNVGVHADSFYTADRWLRDWLQLYGFENSVAWIASDSTGSHFYQRHNYGASARPLFEETRLSWADSAWVAGASLPGTPFFPSGKTRTSAWSILLSAEARLERVAADSGSITVRYDRLRSSENEEFLVTVQRLQGQYPFEDVREINPADTLFGPDTLWALDWSGFAAKTDFSAWRALTVGTSVPFQLFKGDGLRMTANGAWQVLGTPAVNVPFSGGVLIGNADWSMYAGEYLSTLVSDSTVVDVEAWSLDPHSAWASRMAPPLINDLTTDAPSEIYEEALTYLLNWDFGYDRASIAASIFDTWMSIYQDTTGTLPKLEGDSLGSIEQFTYRPLRNRTLEQAIAHLEATYSDDLSQWRWERVQPERRAFALWAADSLGSTTTNLPARARYGPISLPGRGHPTALAWGTSPIQQGAAATATWEAWISTADWDVFSIRRRSLDPNATLGRYLVSDQIPSPFTLESRMPEHRTALIPKAAEKEAF